MNEQQLREQMVSLASSLFQRGYVSGGAGNMSAKLPDGNFLATPTCKLESNIEIKDPCERSSPRSDNSWLASYRNSDCHNHCLDMKIYSLYT